MNRKEQILQRIERVYATSKNDFVLCVLPNYYETVSGMQEGAITEECEQWYKETLDKYETI